MALDKKENPMILFQNLKEKKIYHIVQVPTHIGMQMQVDSLQRGLIYFWDRFFSIKIVYVVTNFTFCFIIIISYKIFCLVYLVILRSWEFLNLFYFMVIYTWLLFKTTSY